MYHCSEQLSSPLALNLTGGPIQTLGLASGVHFDHDGNGFAQLTGWVAPTEYLLAWDRNGNGQIDNGRELFGNSTILSDGTTAANGFTALAALDENGDGVVDANDPIFSDLRLWRDANSNGRTDEGELFTLAELGVASLRTSYTLQNVVDDFGNQHLQTGTFSFTDGTTGQMVDVWFIEDTARTRPVELVDVPEDIAALPNVAGFGNVYSLHQAMSRDESGTLRALVEQFAAETNAATRAALLEQLIFTWAGVANADVRPYGHQIDGHRVATLEQFLGEPFIGKKWGTPNVCGAAAVSALNEAFDLLAGYVENQLMAQTHLAPMLESVTLTIDPETWALGLDFSSAIALLRNAYTADNNRGFDLVQSLAPRYLRSFGEAGEEMLELLRAEGELCGEDFSHILATAGYNVIKGTENAESLTGAPDNDLIWGGPGNDTIAGGSGNNILLFNRGDGRDVILADSAEGCNELRFGPGIAQSDIRLKAA